MSSFAFSTAGSAFRCSFRCSFRFAYRATYRLTYRFTYRLTYRLTYWLTYLYAACTRSISTVLPAFYAHLAAYRGKLLVEAAP